MKPVVKKALIGVGIGLAVLGTLAYIKVQKLKKIFEQITIKPVGVKNLKISFTQISLVTDLLFSNPTKEDFAINGYVGGLTRLNFFYSGKYIATANPVVTEITIPANNQLLFKNIPVVLPTKNILGAIMEMSDFNIDKLEVEAVIKVAGNEYYIK